MHLMHTRGRSTFTDVVPFFEKYRILVTTRLSLEQGLDQNGW